MMITDKMPAQLEMSFDIGMHDGPRVTISLAGGRLSFWYRDFGPFCNAPSQELPSPSRESMQRFLSDLEQADVWNWETSYFPGGLDGIVWHLHLLIGDRTLESGACNGYPDEAESGYLPGGRFDRLLDALQRLTGRDVRKLIWTP